MTAHGPTLTDESLVILLVEDISMNQIVIEGLLKRAGHAVSIAGDGALAVRAVQDHPFDMVLMDIQMPNMDGLDATRAIRNLAGGIGALPIIALTANATANMRERCREAGMDDFLTKPVLYDTLIHTIERWAPTQH